MAFSNWDKENAPDENTYAFAAETNLKEMVVAGIERGVFREMDPAVASKCVWASVHGLAILLASMEEFPHGMPGSEHVTRDAVIDFQTNMIIRGLSAGTAPA
jgi:hypothetical protein